MAMLEEEELRDAILLVFANKQDSRGALNSRHVRTDTHLIACDELILLSAMTALQVSDALGLPEIKNRQWSIQETSALKGSGLFEGFDWFASFLPIRSTLRNLKL